MQFGYTDPNDSEGLMNLLSAGAQIIIFVTGRGSVIGCPISPLIKITGNPNTFNKLKGDMDINAGRILNGEVTFKEATDELQEFIVRICKGEKTKSEALKHREHTINYKYEQLSNRDNVCQ